ncbi:uncharacterized protein LOC117262140 isoform X3 [Epinephelus lanceolatus]
MQVQNMAENWRSPYPYQQNPGGQPGFQCQQQGPSVPNQPSSPYPPSPPPLFHPGLPCPMASCSAPAGTPSGGTPQMTLSQLYAQPRPSIQPPTQPPTYSLLRYILQEIRDLVKAPSQSGTHQEAPNPILSTANPDGRVQAGPSREGSRGNVNPGLQCSQYLMQATLKVQTPTTAQAPPQQKNLKDSARTRLLPLHSPDPSSSSEGDLGPLSSYSPTSPRLTVQLSEEALESRNEGHLSVQALSQETCEILEQEYGVLPEHVECFHWRLPDGVPTTIEHKDLVKKLRTLLHPVPAGPFCQLVRSFPIKLRKRLRRVRFSSYIIRKAENKWLQREHLRLTEQEIANLRNQVLELTQAKDALQQQLVGYQALQQEVRMLRDQVASYRRLRMVGISAYVSDGQQLDSNTG